MKYIFIFFKIFFLLNLNATYAREIGQTEITADNGVEVFQDEKFYILKDNVKIISDNFELFGDLIKIYFEKDLYDIQKIDAKGSVILTSEEYGIDGKGDMLFFEVDLEKISISGNSSKLNTNEMMMSSDGKIIVENIDGKFFIEGPNSNLTAEDIYIDGNNIYGEFIKNNEGNEIIFLDVKDNNESYIKTEDTEMFSKKAIYNKDSSLIELFDNVKIIRGSEVVNGDYGTLDTKNNSYKVKSNNNNKVKVIITNKNE